MKIINLDQIREILPSIDLITEIEAGFVAYSQGKAEIPPVGELIFKNPPGDVHIKYGYLHDDDFYVIKIASGFYNNNNLGLPSGNGLMLLFNQKSGELLAVLLDEGHLTDIRTAVAGAVAAKYLAPENVQRIGVFGTGIQGKLQVQYLDKIIKCKHILAWGRNDTSLDAYKKTMESDGYFVETTKDAEKIGSDCKLIIMATPSKAPLIMSQFVQKGTHITAVGSDTSEKQELDTNIIKNADLVVADSISQCLERGEIFKALNENVITRKNLVELGEILSGNKHGRTSDGQITIADLTGVAVQDIQISKAVYKQFIG